MTLVQRASDILDRPISRRGFVRRLTYGATALATAPLAYSLKPGTAYAAICNCSGSNCDCNSMCCDGYTEFCCSITGQNVCPSGTIPAGWWKADGSGVCDNTSGPQPRYYLDCNIADCGGCGCGGSGICSGNCQNPHVYGCGCANGNCGLRKAGCTGFRYGQCNQEVACVGPIVCRVVTCTAPWVWTDDCATAPVLTDNGTRFHNAECLQNATALPNTGIPVVGDWTGSGITMPGMFVNGRWHLRRSDGGPNIVFNYGRAGDVPVVGDWNDNGVDTPGVFRRGQWYLRNSNTSGVADVSFSYGKVGDTPFAGNWNDNGVDKPGVYRSSNRRVYLRNSNSSGVANIEFGLGNSGDIPVVGDFNGTGGDTVSLYRPSQRAFHIVNQLGNNGGPLPPSDTVFVYGSSGDRPLAGDWNDDDTATIDVFRAGVFYLRNSNSSGFAHIVYQ